MSRSRRPAVLALSMPSPAALIVSEIAVVTTCLGLLAIGFGSMPVLATGISVAVLPFLTIRSRTVFGWLRVCSRFVTGRRPEIGVTTEYTDSAGNPVGIHWQSDSVTCTVEIAAPRHEHTVLGRSSADTRHPLPIAALASCFRQHDIELTGIDVVALGFRSSAGSAATDVYEGLIGPLPAVAVRTVWVAVTLDLRRNAAAIEVRGGGRAGSARTAAIAATRVVRALQAHGLTSRILSGPELRAATSHICRGVSTDDLTQLWSTAPLPGVSSTGFGIDCSAVTSDDLAAIWAVPSVGTTVALHLRPTRSGGRVDVRASCRFATRTPLVRPDVRALTSMSGAQRDGILAQLPLAIRGMHSLSPTEEVGVAELESLAFPASGCGQLLGSDSAGNGVAARLFGLGLETVHVAGELYLAQQLMFRAVATGARILVRTDRPHAWTSLADSIAAPDRLLIDGRPSHSRGVYTVVLLDFTDAFAADTQQRRAGTTVVTLTEHVPRTPMPDPDMSIVQPNASGDLIHVRSGDLDTALTLVTIPQETAFIGRPRSLRPAAHA